MGNTRRQIRRKGGRASAVLAACLEMEFMVRADGLEWPVHYLVDTESPGHWRPRPARYGEQVFERQNRGGHNLNQEPLPLLGEWVESSAEFLAVMGRRVDPSSP